MRHTGRSEAVRIPRVSDAARAVGRFKPDGPDGYRARSLPDGPLRATRAEAEADELAFLEARHG